MNKAYYVTLFLIIGVCILCSNRINAQQNTPPDMIEEINFIFLVDQSGSMGGASFGYPDRNATDPLNLRFEAVQYALDTLWQYRPAFTPETTMQIAVINFGDTAQVSLDWTEIAPPNATEEDLDRVLEALSVDRFGAVNLGNTNFVAAINQAQTLIDQLSNQDHVLNVLILLTDGEPCVPDDFDCGNRASELAHMRDVTTLVNASLMPDSTLIYVIALDDTGDLWQQFRDEWVQVTGTDQQVSRAEDSQQIGVGFLNILTNVVAYSQNNPTPIAPLQLAQGSNTVIVPPYHSEMRISLFKSDNLPGDLQIERPDGYRLTTADASLMVENQDRPIEIWTIKDPLPGEWKFQLGASVNRLDAFLQLIPIDTEVDIAANDFELFQNLDIGLTITRGNGQALPQYVAPYTLTVETTVIYPDGSSQTFNLNQNTNSLYSNTVRLDQMGSYQVGIRASSQSPDGLPYIVYNNDAVLQFDVDNIRYEFENALSGEYLAGEQLETNIILQDNAGQALTLPELSIDIAIGNHLPQTLTDDNGDGIYPLSIPLETPGTYTLSATAQTRDQQGQTDIIGILTEEPIEGVASQPVAIHMLEQPTDPYMTTGFPQFTPIPNRFVFEVILSETGNRIEPRTYLTSASNPFDIQLYQENDMINDQLVPTQIESGLYELILPDLGSGMYRLVLNLQGNTSERYLITPNSHAVVTFNRQTHPHLLIRNIVVIATIVLIVSSLALLAYTIYKRRQHPAKGHLVLSVRRLPTDEPRILWDKKLETFERNYISLGKRELHLKSNDPIKRIIIRCTDEQMQKRGRVKVTVHGQEAYRLDDRMLEAGTILTIGQSGRRVTQDISLKPVYYLQMKSGFNEGSDSVMGW